MGRLTYNTHLQCTYTGVVIIARTRHTVLQTVIRSGDKRENRGGRETLKAREIRGTMNIIRPGRSRPKILFPGRCF